MEKVIIKSTAASAISAASVELIGLIINLISYRINGNFLLAQRLYGGEWQGQRGFGLLLNTVYPIVTSDNPVMQISQRITFDANSLIKTLLCAFWIAFIVFFIVFSIARKSAKKKSHHDPDHKAQRS